MVNRKIEVGKCSRYFHNKVLILNVLLTFIIVLLHSIPLDRIGIDTDAEYPFVHVVNVFSQVGVPMFFFISALLFYKGLELKMIQDKLKRRYRSLVIPYFLWNIVFVFVFWCMTHVNAISSMMNMNPVPSDAGGLLLSVIDSKYTVLWFVKNLIIYSLLAPVFLLFICNKYVGMIFIVGLAALNMFHNFGYDHLLHWMPIYMLGAFIGYHKLCITPPSKDRRLAMLCIIAYLSLYILAVINDKNLFVYRFLSPFLVWVMFDKLCNNLAIENFVEKEWMHGTFFIYCTHFFFINIFQKLAFKILPHTHLFVNIILVITPFLVFSILAMVAYKLSDNAIYKIMTGGR